MYPLVIIAGPTAVGKSDIAVKLAKKINGKIISADSMQVYRGMNIGSAKISSEEMDGIEHYLIDVLEPTEDFNVALFQKLALEAIEDIYKKGAIPIIVGGTGFYIQSVLYEIDFSDSEGETSEYRKKLENIASVQGVNYLFEMLRKVDPASCETIHKNNVKRVIRALEFYEETGKPISAHNEEQRAKESRFNYAFFVLNDDREYLYSRIDKRVDKMVDCGLVDEVQKLMDLGLTRNDVSMQGLGYKEILMYLEHECSLEDALEIVKRDSRRFAKRQITWFKREPEAIWIDKQNYSRDDNLVLSEMINKLKEKEII